MVIVIVILSVLFAVAFLMVIFLASVLSKFVHQESLVDVSEAYNDRYYRAKVLVICSWNQEQESLVADFSRWEDGVAAFIYNLREPRPVDLSRDWFVLDDALVYEVADGIWMWKKNC